MLVKGLPLAYNRDLQEDKEPLFDAFDTVEACLELAAVVVDGATLRADRIAERLDEGFLDATTLMEYLIRGVSPSAPRHEVIGRLVGLCERRGREAPGRPLRRRARRGAPRARPRGPRRARRRERHQGVPVVRLDRAGGGGETIGTVEGSARGLIYEDHRSHR